VENWEVIDYQPPQRHVQWRLLLQLILTHVKSTNLQIASWIPANKAIAAVTVGIAAWLNLRVAYLICRQLTCERRQLAWADRWCRGCCSDCWRRSTEMQHGATRLAVDGRRQRGVVTGTFKRQWDEDDEADKMKRRVDFKDKSDTCDIWTRKTQVAEHHAFTNNNR